MCKKYINSCTQTYLNNILIFYLLQTLLLGLRYPELSWDFAKPSREELPECLPCLFLQFAVLENGARVYKVLQIFSKYINLNKSYLRFIC